MKDIIGHINFCYVVVVFLLLFIGLLYLKRRGIDKKYRNVFIIGYVILTIFSFNYVNGIFFSIFSLKYLDVKSYLFVIGVMNLIVLLTIHKEIKRIYMVYNYVTFIFLTIIFGATMSIIIGDKVDSLYVMDISNAVTLIDLSLVIFILYLIITGVTYIGYCLLIDSREELEAIKENNFKFRVPKVRNKRQEKKSKSKDKIMSPEELLSCNRENGFYIGGEDASIIFEDSNQDNIIKNYYILLEDIHAKLVNGYTLEENRMLKSICTKLGVFRISSIDMGNVSILNRISIEEYNLLRRVFNID